MILGGKENKMLQIVALASGLLLCASAAQQPADVGLETGALPFINLEDLSTVQADAESSFYHWARQHGKAYLHDLEEAARRLSVFKQNVEFMLQHNAANPSVTLGLNEFTDLSFEEFKATRLGLDTNLAPAEQPHLLSTFRYADKTAPRSIDWEEKGAVTAVKNQGQCGSCWAFSTTGSIEGANFLDTGRLSVLSEQELVDCDHAKDNGCGGGLMNNAFEYIIKNGGLDTEDDYAYWGAFPSFCNRRKEADRHVVDITGFEQVPANDEAALAKAVAHQPVSVAICVNPALMMYRSGVFDAECCTGLNHGVLLVGYAEADHGGEYWRVKNSWGPAWGEDGYFKLKKGLGGEGQCGVAMMASYPVKDDGTNPHTVSICDPQLLSLWECPFQTSCNCEFDLFGLVCLNYSCKPAAAVACGDGEHYCPTNAPVCDYETGRCHDEDHQLNSPLLTAQPARRRR